ncbi:UDP-glucose 4-epimerase GalE [Polaromonas sp.]|uniref:UDP-glucose 4-epimerase GalE n=1 Tax=Polaromonas sp. TaxID=1869339 RepID=UPI0025F0C236|nr:UDP-glucose 4-epimerase GalE [Polaromonas sp.]
MIQHILLTGGAGYIGSHTCVALVHAGYTPVIVDNFSNSHPAVLPRLRQITGQAIACEQGDVADAAFMTDVLRRYRVQAVMHFAGYKAVGESVAQPLKYYRNNLASMLGLLEAMTAAGCRTLVFSSSATVYGDPHAVPMTEDFPRSHTNPYGHTKLMIEDMLASLCRADPAWAVAVLRYFNPVGAHPGGLIGDDPSGIPNNLMPYISQVAVGKRPQLQVFGNDYPTVDGTGVRDYIHVLDLAEGHVAALNALLEHGQHLTVNLGTGQGHSVLQVVRAFEQASGREVPCQIMPRRAGDVAQCYADPSLARQLLGWQARRSLAEMCGDAWRWQSQNPDGYRFGAPAAVVPSRR